MTYSAKAVATSPSIRRWSADSDHGSVGRAFTSPSTTNGRGRMAPNPMIPTSGGRISGVANRPPREP